ncbi:facilitated trehalose transporter Tret1-like [Rhagoletis pomonella]|uniref:facilitated trehalose transporter Tret1-like n=1 Tax=Rhagoletis pomonella TaxID=28610 RepID=UPI00177DD8C5|nr:facilitated trehalose transporter Tret1-like [Rhagoletis pomonella]
MAAAGGALACGATIGWSSPAQAELTGENDYGITFSTNEYAWIGSLMTLGAATVCLPVGVLITIIGPKWTMMFMVIPFEIGWALMIFAQNQIMMYIARFLTGMAGGAFCVCAPMYCTEISQKEVRGIIGSFFQLLITTGVLYGFAVGAFTKAFWFSIICALPPLVFAIVFIFCPDSPVFLVRKGKLEPAIKSMEWLRGKDVDFSAELNEIKANHAEMKENPVNLGNALCRKVTLKAFGLSVSLMVLQQFSGINAVIFYSSSIFQSTTSNLEPRFGTIIIGVMLVVATVVSLFIIDRYGRVPLLLLSSVFQVISVACLSLYFFLKESDEKSVENLGWLPLLSICIYILLFSVGFGPVPWVFMAEVFPDDIKGIAGSLSATTNWACAFIVTQVFPVLNDAIGGGACFAIFAIISAVGGVYIFFFIPETKGKTFAEIQAELAGEN